VTEPVGERVEVVEDERVAPHGTVHTWWFVRQADAWVKAGKWPGALTEPRDAGPGTVWERVVRLVAPTGTEFMQVVVRPRPPARRDPLSYLEHTVKRAPNATDRRYYRVLRGGRLQVIPALK
jgi:hypothetical protein